MVSYERREYELLNNIHIILSFQNHNDANVKAIHLFCTEWVSDTATVGCLKFVMRDVLIMILVSCEIREIKTTFTEEYFKIIELFICKLGFSFLRTPCSYSTWGLWARLHIPGYSTPPLLGFWRISRFPVNPFLDTTPSNEAQTMSDLNSAPKSHHTNPETEFQL